MDFGAIDPVAIYAAVVSTIALGWQIRKERRARRPQVEVKVSYALLGYPSRGPAEVAHIEARNRGDLPVRVNSAGFNLQDGSGNALAITWQPPGATLPGVIGPRCRLHLPPRGRAGPARPVPAARRLGVAVDRRADPLQAAHDAAPIDPPGSSWPRGWRTGPAHVPPGGASGAFRLVPRGASSPTLAAW